LELPPGGDQRFGGRGGGIVFRRILYPGQMEGFPPLNASPAPAAMEFLSGVAAIRPRIIHAQPQPSLEDLGLGHLYEWSFDRDLLPIAELQGPVQSLHKLRAAIGIDRVVAGVGSITDRLDIIS